MNGIYILVDTYMSFFERGREFLSPLRSDDRLRRTIAAEFVEIAFFMRFLERGRELIAAQVVGSKLLMLLIYIILLASAMLARADVVSVVVNIIHHVAVSSRI